MPPATVAESLPQEVGGREGLSDGLLLRPHTIVSMLINDMRAAIGGAGGGEVFSREHCGQTLVRRPDEGVHLAKFPGKLAPGIARIGAAEDLAVDATGQQKIGVGSVRGQVPDRAVAGYW